MHFWWCSVVEIDQMMSVIEQKVNRLTGGYCKVKVERSRERVRALTNDDYVTATRVTRLLEWRLK